MVSWYQQELLDHYRQSPHRGRLETPSFSSEQINPSCGDQIRFEGRIEDGRLVDVRFDGTGCVISQAAASMLAQAVIGSSISDIQKMTSDDMLSLIKIPLGPVRLRCALLALEALHQGLAPHAN